MADAHSQFRTARDFLLATRTDYDRAVGEYVPPRPQDFNWALDWFDRVASALAFPDPVGLRARLSADAEPNAAHDCGGMTAFPGS